LAFEHVSFQVVFRDQQQWLMLSQLAEALYGKRGSQNATPFESRVRDLYRRHSDEFSDKMTALVEMATAGGKQMVRIFSLRGAHLLAMFARTDVAKAFRRWVLDLLEREVMGQAAAPDDCCPDARQQLQCAVRALQSKMTSHQVYRRVHLQFGVNSIDDLGARMPQAVAFVNGLAASWELVDQPALPAPAQGLSARDLENMTCLCNEVEYVRSAWGAYCPHLEALTPLMAGQLGEHILGAAAAARHLVRDHDLPSDREYAAGYPWRGSDVARRAYVDTAQNQLAS
jgi:prophage antirepressor-like protein